MKSQRQTEYRRIGLAAVSMALAGVIQGTLISSFAATTNKPQLFYVATNGSDKNNGSMAHPWATVQHAVDVVPNGATIYLLSGVYHQ